MPTLNDLFRRQCELDREQCGIYVPIWMTKGSERVPDLATRGTWIMLPKREDADSDEYEPDRYNMDNISNHGGYGPKRYHEI